MSRTLLTTTFNEKLKVLSNLTMNMCFMRPSIEDRMMFNNISQYSYGMQYFLERKLKLCRKLKKSQLTIDLIQARHDVLVDTVALIESIREFSELYPLTDPSNHHRTIWNNDVLVIENAFNLVKEDEIQGSLLG